MSGNPLVGIVGLVPQRWIHPREVRSSPGSMVSSTAFRSARTESLGLGEPPQAVLAAPRRSR